MLVPGQESAPDSTTVYHHILMRVTLDDYKKVLTQPETWGIGTGAGEARFPAMVAEIIRAITWNFISLMQVWMRFLSRPVFESLLRSYGVVLYALYTGQLRVPRIIVPP